MIDDPDAKHRVPNALGLEDAKVRVAELARWGYTEARVLNDLRLRVERIESKFGSKIGSEPALEAAELRGASDTWPLCAVCGKSAREGKHSTDLGEGHDYVPLAVAEARPALYANRYAFRLEPHYSRHVNAMTAEGLHSKGAIAAELAHRDQQITRLREALSSARREITRLGTDGGGFSCAVIDDIDAALGERNVNGAEEAKGS